MPNRSKPGNKARQREGLYPQNPLTRLAEYSNLVNFKTKQP